MFNTKKTIDNLRRIERIMFQPNQPITEGYSMVANSEDGDVIWANPLENLPYEETVQDKNMWFISPYFTDKPAQHRFSSLDSCLLHLGTLTYTDPQDVHIGSGTYFSFGNLDWPPGVQLTGPFNAQATIILINPCTYWFYISGGTTSVHNVIFFGLQLCVDIFRLDGDGASWTFVSTVLSGAVNTIAIYGGTGSNLVMDGSGMFDLDLTALGLGPCHITGYGVDTTNANDIIIYYYNSTSGSQPFFFPPFLWGTPFKLFMAANNTTLRMWLNSNTAQSTAYTVNNSTVVCLAVNDNLHGTVWDIDNNSKVDISASSLDATAYDILVRDTASKVRMTSGVIDTSKVGLPSNTSNILLQYSDILLNNGRGFHNSGDLIQGGIEFSSNSFFGQGGAVTKSLILLKYNGSTYNDVTSLLTPDNPVTTTIFNSTSAGNMFYVGHPLIKISTLSMNVITALSSLNINDVLIEYWNGSAWTVTQRMSTSSQSPYTSYANQLLSQVALLEIRLNVLITLGTTWQKTTVNSVNAYWIRFRISSGISINPVINTCFIYGSSLRIDPLGAVTCYGASRSQKTSFYSLNLFESVASITGPQNGDIYMTKTLAQGSRANSFRNTGDSIYFSLLLPSDIDTSSPLSLTVCYYSSSALPAQQAFAFTFIYGVAVADTTVMYYTSATAPTSAAASSNQQSLTNVSFPLNATNGSIMRIIEVNLDMSFFRARINQLVSQLLFISMQRVTGANTANTIVANLNYSYYSVGFGSVKI